MTSKQRAELRGQANTIDVTLMVGKGGVSEALIAETQKLLDAHELVKGRVLEAAMLTAREACDALCEATGADGIQVVGGTFVIYRKSEKLERERKAAEQAKKTAKKVNPVKLGVQSRRKQAKKEKERKQKYFHDAAVKAAIERRKQREQ